MVCLFVCFQAESGRGPSQTHCRSGFPKWFSPHSSHCCPPNSERHGHCPVTWTQDSPHDTVQQHLCAPFDLRLSRCLLGSCLVTDVGHRVGGVTAAGLTPRRSVHVPVPVLALIAEDAQHALPAGTLSRHLVAETGTPQRTVGHLGPPPLTRALWAETRRPRHANADTSRENGAYLCSPVPERCRSTQACSRGSEVPWCCGGSAGILPSRRRRRSGRPGQCCCCRNTAHTERPAMPGCHSNQGCISHSSALKESECNNRRMPSGPGCRRGPVPPCPSLQAQLRLRD